MFQITKTRLFIKKNVKLSIFKAVDFAYHYLKTMNPYLLPATNIRLNLFFNK